MPTISRGAAGRLEPADHCRQSEADEHRSGESVDPAHGFGIHAGIEQTADMPQIIACHHVSGDASFSLHVRADDVSELEAVVGRLSPLGQTHTAILLSTPVDKTAMMDLS